VRTVVVYCMHQADTALTLIRVSAQPPHARRYRDLHQRPCYGNVQRAMTCRADAGALGGHAPLRVVKPAEALASAA
jgi:hypothetical protein